MMELIYKNEIPWNKLNAEWKLSEFFTNMEKKIEGID